MPKLKFFLNESILKTFTRSFEAWIPDRNSVNQGKQFQHDTGMATNVNSPLYVEAAHQKTKQVIPNSPVVNLSNNRSKKVILDKGNVLK